MTPEEFANLEPKLAESEFAALCAESTNSLALKKLFLALKSKQCFNINILVAGAMGSISNNNIDMFENIVKFSEQHNFTFQYEHIQAMYNMTAGLFNVSPHIGEPALNYLDDKYNILEKDLIEQTNIYTFFKDNGAAFAGYSPYNNQYLWEEFSGNITIHAAKNNLSRVIEKLLSSKHAIPDYLLTDIFFVAYENMHKSVISMMLEYPAIFQYINNNAEIIEFIGNHRGLSATSINFSKDISDLIKTISFKNDLEIDLENNHSPKPRIKI